MAALRVLFVFILTFFTIGCMHSETFATHETLIPGNRFVATEPLVIVMRGSRAIVVRHADRTSLEETDRVIPPDTQLEISEIRKDNTWTRGVESWPLAIVLDGEHRGQEVSLQIEAARRTLRISPK